jgi:hypothetical protein
MGAFDDQFSEYHHLIDEVWPGPELVEFGGRVQFKIDKRHVRQERGRIGDVDTATRTSCSGRRNWGWATRTSTEESDLMTGAASVRTGAGPHHDKIPIGFR